MSRIMSAVWMFIFWLLMWGDDDPLFYMCGAIVWGFLYIGDCLEHHHG